MLYAPSLIFVFVQIFIASLLYRAYKDSGKNSQVLCLLIITLTFTVWTAVNTILLQDFTQEKMVPLVNVINTLGFFLGSVIIAQLYNFSYYFPKIIAKSKLQKVMVYTVFGLTVFNLSPAVIGRYVFDGGSSSAVYHSGSMTSIFIAYIVLVMVMYVVRSLKESRKSAETKHQVKTVIYGLGLSALHAIIFIIILPIWLGEQNVIFAIGYLAPVYFVVATSYSLLKQQLFNIRAAVARASTYLLVLMTVLLVYGIIIFAVSGVFFSSANISIGLRISYLFVGVVLAFTIQPLRKFFDNYSNKLFYRDAYDAQELLDELNKILVSTINVQSLVEDTVKTIGAYIKPDFTYFYLPNTTYSSERFIGDKTDTFDNNELALLHDLISNNPDKIIATDLVSQKSGHEKLFKLLQSNNVGILARMVTVIDPETKSSGYIFIGRKKSGNPYSKQDIGLIEIITNELVIAIQNAIRFEEIEKFNITLQKEIEDATRRLRRNNDKLKVLDSTKDEFISMASHQLRTPLTSVKGYMSMVIDGDAGKLNPKQQELLEQAFTSSQRMVYLIADLLNVSRLHTGKFVIDRVSTQLADVVEGELAQLRETAKAKNIVLEFKKPKNFPSMMLDETKTRQVIMNFADNAIHYTPDGGKIQVTLLDRGDSVEYLVSDNGIGVPKADQHHMFTKFYRAGNARVARPDGTGLGLFMAKKVIIAQGGAVIFSSQEGKGSTFGFTFPKTPKNSN